MMPPLPQMRGFMQAALLATGGASLLLLQLQDSIGSGKGHGNGA